MKRNLIPLLASLMLVPVQAFGQSPKPAGPPAVDPFKNPAPAEPKKQDKEKKQETGEKELVDLRPKFEKGQVIRFRMELDQNSTTVIPALDDKPTHSIARQEMGLVFKVKEANDHDGSTVELSFSRIKMTKKTEGTENETEEFDSGQPTSKDKNSPAAPSLRALANTTLTLYLDRDGNLSRIEGGDALMSLDAFGVPPGTLNPGSLPPGTPPPHPPPPAPPAPGGGTTSQTFKEALGNIFSIKKGPGLVSVGEEWTNADEMDTGLLSKFKITSRHKLKSHNGGEAKVSVMGGIEPGSQDNEMLSLAKIRDCSFVGDYSWNTREGMLRRMNANMHVVLEASIAGGATVTSDMKSVVTRN